MAGESRLGAVRLACAGMAAASCLWAAACSDGGVTTECTGSEVRECTGDGDCAGEERCDEGRWGDCECFEQSGTGGMGGEGGTAPERLGAPCDSDGDCTAPATCVGPGATAFLGGGLARGACLVDCTEGAAACDAFSNAVCVDTSPPGSEGERAFCFEGCRFGSLEQSKCEGRTDAACERLEGGDGDEGFCRPMCAADGDCGDGRVCDPRLGACIPETSELPEFELGAACVTESESEDCAGVCLGAAGETGVCTARCVFGSREPCGDAAERSACLLTTPGGTVGDVGYCVALCDCDGDCTTSETGCVPLGDATLEAVFGARGVCAVGGEGGAAGTLACE